MITIAPLLDILRIDESGYGSKYHTLLIIIWLDPKIVFLCAFLGTMTRDNYKEFHDILRDKGVESIARIRHGKLEVKDLV